MASEWSEAERNQAAELAAATMPDCPWTAEGFLDVAAGELSDCNTFEQSLAQGYLELAARVNCLRDALEHLLTLNNLRDRTDPDCCESCQFVAEARAALAKCPKEGRNGR